MVSEREFDVAQAACPHQEAPPKILLVDRRCDYTQQLSALLAQAGFSVIVTDQLRKARTFLNPGHDLRLVVLDIQLPGQDGLDLLRNRPAGAPPILVVTDDLSGPHTIEVMRWGAYDHLSKSATIESIVEAIKGATHHTEEFSPGAPFHHETYEPLWGVSEPMRQLQKQVGLAASSEATVLITGATGTGKDLVAQAVHNYGRRSAKPFVPINCATIPTDLLESELFGHVKGAFTGAVGHAMGRFQEAEGGTLFLDEIGDMPAGMQVKLLRALQQKEIRPLGADHALKVNVRIIAATHRSLPELVRQSHFRQDLFFRLNVINLTVPELRAHAQDIPLLADYFLRKYMMPDQPKKLTVAAVQRLMEYSWPGNVRELENVMQTAAVMSRCERVTAADLALPETHPGRQEVPGDWSDLPYREAMSRLEKNLLEQALKKANGNRSAAAKRLGLYRQQFYSKLRCYGLL